MTKTQVLALLKDNRDARGEAHWLTAGYREQFGLKSFGIGLTKLRKLAKTVGKSHDLAAQLWASDVYDLRVLGALIDEPKKMTREQAERQVDQLVIGLAHVYCSCDAALAKTGFAQDLAVDWMESKDDTRRRCGYLLLYELGKSKKIDDAFFLPYVERIPKVIQKEDNWVKEAMNGSLLSIGKRSRALNQAVIAAAEAMGPVEVDYGEGNSCETLDVLKHMRSDWLRKKLTA